MAAAVLVTGATGALGPHLLAELLTSDAFERIFVLLRRSARTPNDVRELNSVVGQLARASDPRRAIRLDRLVAIAGDINRGDLGLERDTTVTLCRELDVVIHAAANTCFSAPLDDLYVTNVTGTRSLLQLAVRCRRLRQFLHVSTLCVAGTRTGAIAERLEAAPPGFVNPYEQTKWQAEHLAAASGLPVRIARLSTCIGSEHTGYVHRFGAFHHAINWLLRGLVPMIPGSAQSRLDLIATDVAARWIAHAVTQQVNGVDVCQIALGEGAIPLEQLLRTAVAHFQARRKEWGRRQVEPPVIVDRETFELFQRSVSQSGDLLFTRVLDSARAFLPALLYPKVYQTERAERCWGGRLQHSGWQTTLERVIEFGCAKNWGRDGRYVSRSGPRTPKPGPRTSGYDA